MIRAFIVLAPTIVAMSTDSVDSEPELVDAEEGSQEVESYSNQPASQQLKVTGFFDNWNWYLDIQLKFMREEHGLQTFKNADIHFCNQLLKHLKTDYDEEHDTKEKLLKFGPTLHEIWKRTNYYWMKFFHEMTKEEQHAVSSAWIKLTNVLKEKANELVGIEFEFYKFEFIKFESPKFESQHEQDQSCVYGSVLQMSRHERRTYNERFPCDSIFNRGIAESSGRFMNIFQELLSVAKKYAENNEHMKPSGCSGFDASYTYGDEHPLNEIYAQEGPDCWLHAAATVVHAHFLQWFEKKNIGLSTLFPFDFVKNDRDVHDLLIKFGSFDGQKGGSFALSVFRVSRVLGALLCLFGGQENRSIALDWMDGGMIKQVVRFEGKDILGNVEAMQQENFGFPYYLGIDLEQKNSDGEESEHSSHAVVLLGKKKTGQYHALNSWGTADWDTDFYQNQRNPDDLAGCFTVDFNHDQVSKWAVSCLNAPGGDVANFDIARDLFNIHPLELLDFVEKNPDIFPAGVDTIGKQFGQTALNTCFQTPHMSASLEIEIVEALLEAGASLTVCDEFGTPLHQALLKGSVEIMKILLENAHDVKQAIDLPNSSGVSVLFCAILENNIEMVQALTEAGASWTVCGKFGTPLNEALHMGSLEIMKIFLEHDVKQAIDLPDSA